LAGARRKDSSSLARQRAPKPPGNITETDMLTADTEQLTALLDMDLFGGVGMPDQFSNLEDDMAILDDSADLDLPPPPTAQRRASPLPLSSIPARSRAETPLKTVAAATAAGAAQKVPVASTAVAQKAAVSVGGDAALGVSEASARAVLEDGEHVRLLEASQRAAGEEQAAQVKAVGLRDKMAAAPNPVMRTRFAAEVRNAEAALTRAAEARAAAESAVAARRAHVANAHT
jgi:hypothetical protein